MDATLLPSSTVARLKLCLTNQARRNIQCPHDNQIGAKLALVTGATSGIGREIASGLLERGIGTILAGRSPEKLEAVRQEFCERGIEKSLIRTVAFDLSDLESVAAGVTAIEQMIGSQNIEVLLENAGVWPRRYSETQQGFEIAVGTNVLGHFALRSGLERAGLLATAARIVILTGDIYASARECTLHYRYRGPLGGMRAYSRSKLGNIWIARELQRHRPEYTVVAVHPGVVATNLGGSGRVGRKLKSLLMIPPVAGSQMPLYCATRTDIVKGGYYLNTRGLCRFPPDDPAIDEWQSLRFWHEVESIAGV
ncbi:MAG: SDR family NAD(P)-dependent oxidoreductase [Spirochaetales bacterium]|nr:SDR family NAD(P)-dependent oxidoreductase [Leptospiraceae bacterium]MCP5482489.1 SDR family NAD(P)-dependent oxidoreductase [Spirochaetales bacterium]MCP5485807.1 SDR family NAD(P)-dependent oxidoreductase [Spirochaetales bacterium]